MGCLIIGWTSPSYPHKWISLSLISQLFYNSSYCKSSIYPPTPTISFTICFIPLYIFNGTDLCDLSLFRAVSAIVTIVKFNLVLNTHCLVIFHFRVEKYLFSFGLVRVLFYLKCCVPILLHNYTMEGSGEGITTIFLHIQGWTAKISTHSRRGRELFYHHRTFQSSPPPGRNCWQLP